MDMMNFMDFCWFVQFKSTSDLKRMCVLLADELEVLSLVRPPGVDGLVAPHVHAHVEERAPDFSGRRRREGARRETGCGCGRAGREKVTTSELHFHLISPCRCTGKSSKTAGASQAPKIEICVTPGCRLGGTCAVRPDMVE